LQLSSTFAVDFPSPGSRATDRSRLLGAKPPVAQLDYRNSTDILIRGRKSFNLEVPVFRGIAA
jgi:hypothetical protein